MIALILLSDEEQINGKYTSVALGVFDGVHRGHKAVIDAAAKNAAANDLSAAVCTFRTATVDTKGTGFRPIYSDETKCLLLEHEGAEYVYMPDFSRIKNNSAEDFVRDILRKKMNAKTVVCGRDFRLGRGASCTAEGLSVLCRENGMGLIVVDDITDNGVRICSSDIRKDIAEGDIVSANRLLGHDYAITGEVVNGNHFGRQMNFPTANQRMDSGCVLPKFGVYASYAMIDGKFYKGVTNIGVKPTVEVGDAPHAETYFISFDGDLYGRNIVLRLVDFLRPEKRFPSIEALREQIARDTETVRSREYNI